MCFCHFPAHFPLSLSCILSTISFSCLACFYLCSEITPSLQKKKTQRPYEKKKFWTAPLNTDVDVPIVASNKSWQQWHLQQWSLSTLWRVVQRFQSREQWMFFFFPFKYELWAAIQLHITAADAALANHSTLATRIQGVKGCQGLLRSFKVRFFI